MGEYSSKKSLFLLNRGFVNPYLTHFIFERFFAKIQYLNFIDWIVTFCSGKYVETFHELGTEIEIQKLGFFGYLILRI